MSIRKSDKDHLREKAQALVAVEVVSSHHEESENPLAFYTRHERKPRFVSLQQFHDGLAGPLGGRAYRWNGAFSGRPGLILELAPAIRSRLEHASDGTVGSWEGSLRAWWRLFDRMEASVAGSAFERLDSVRQLTELHAAAALEDESIDRHHFCAFRAVASDTRVAMGLPPLLWAAPEVPKPIRVLPSPNGIAYYWHALKHGWFNALNRWRLVDALLASGQTAVDWVPVDVSEIWLKAAISYRNVQASLPPGRRIPTNDLLRASYSGVLYKDGVFLRHMWEAFFPNATDIRMAFHLCLAGTGWNPQTLLDPPVETTPNAPTRTPFIRQHPGDSAKYILTGFKERGHSEHDVHGEWKIDRSPGRVLHELVQRSWPLREQLLLELEQAKAHLLQARTEGASTEQVEPLWTAVTDLTRRTTSVWVFLHKGEVQVLSNTNCRGDNSGRFLEGLIEGINSRLPATSQIPVIKATDFRDAFAAYIWRVSGGSVWHVQTLLKHRRLQTSVTYLDNTVVNEESAQIWTCFTTALFQQLQSKLGIDHTLLAKLSRDGSVTDQQVARLHDYRNLKKSRIGVGCADPLNPPASIDPTFVPDGVSMCPVQRCTLCFEHGVILDESFDGLCMRHAELDDLQASTPIEAFTGGDFDKEFANLKVALVVFDEHAVHNRVALWATRIASGEHKYPKFDGTQRA